MLRLLFACAAAEDVLLSAGEPAFSFGEPRRGYPALVAPQFGSPGRALPPLEGPNLRPRGPPPGRGGRGGPPLPSGAGFLVPGFPGGVPDGVHIEVHQLGGVGHDAPPPELLHALAGAAAEDRALGGLGGGGVIEVSEPIELGPFDPGLPGVRVMAGGMGPPPGLRGGPKVPGQEIPPAALMQAFSGLLNPVAVPLRAGSRGGGFAGPRGMHPLDRFVHEVLGGLGVQVGVMQVPGLPVGPPGCEKETQAYCRDANATHLFHCLATHASGGLSEGCEATFRKSLPEVCKETLAKNCDLFEEGMLPCLQRQTDLQGDCRDSLEATVQSITTVKDGIERGAVVVHNDGDAERPLVAPPGEAETESYYDQFKSFAERVLRPQLFEETEA